MERFLSKFIVLFVLCCVLLFDILCGCMTGVCILCTSYAHIFVLSFVVL